MNISQAADASGLSAKMIRHYEKIGLLQGIHRSASGYRLYSGEDLHRLRFIHQARRLGFSLEQIRELLSLWGDHRRSSREVKALAIQHLEDLDTRIQELQAMRQIISTLADTCHGDDRPDCPILDNLAASSTDKKTS